MNLQQCLKILELETTGSLQEAKRAYKDLVRVWHPDRFQNNPRLKQKADQKLREINLAYNYLCRHIESNLSRGLSTPKVRSATSPSGIGSGNYADQSESPRSAKNAPAMAGKASPDSSPSAVPFTKAVPQKSFVGRYVSLAFLCVVLAISALVVYLLSNTDKIASKTRGVASEAMEKIIEQIEKNRTTQKNDPLVKPSIDNRDRKFKPGEIEKKFEIHLDSGSIILTETWWEEGKMIMYRVEGGSMGIEKTRVKKIVKR